MSSTIERGKSARESNSQDSPNEFAGLREQKAPRREPVTDMEKREQEIKDHEEQEFIELNRRYGKKNEKGEYDAKSARFEDLSDGNLTFNAEQKINKVRGMLGTIGASEKDLEKAKLTPKEREAWNYDQERVKIYNTSAERMRRVREENRQAYAQKDKEELAKEKKNADWMFKG